MHSIKILVFNVPVNNENVEKLASMIYAPYKVYVAKYEKYEEETLAEELNSIRLVSFYNTLLLPRRIYIFTEFY